MKILLRKIYIILFFISITFSANAQFLEGVWEGEYETLISDGFRVYNYSPVPISFRFELKDSSYKVYSYTVLDNRVKNSMIIHKVFYQQVSPKEFYLEELYEGDSLNIQWACVQKFTLRLEKRKKYTFLQGTWLSDQFGCENGGTVWLRRRNK